MTSIYEKAARDIFLQLHDITDRFGKPPIVSMSFVEIAGDRCSDLLNGFQAAQLLTSGSLHFIQKSSSHIVFTLQVLTAVSTHIQ
jgi:hypothetical protein